MHAIRARQLLRYRPTPISAVKRPASRLLKSNGYCTACDDPSHNHSHSHGHSHSHSHTQVPSTDTKAKVKAPRKESKAVNTPPTPSADHRELGVRQELFTSSIYSPGSPLFLPNGTRVFQKLQAFLRAQYASFGFQEVISPTIYKKSLWQKSGHWDNYAEDMFSVTGRGATGEVEGKQIGEDEEFGLKPMNCPGHCLLFASKARSFRDLPIRFSDFSPLHRNEISGALSGLTRVRRFHQDDGHIFCRPSQVAKEISKTLDFVKLAYSTFRLGPYRLALSTRPKDHYMGTEEEWASAEAALKKALEASGQEWHINEGDGAFYGPKIDIILKDSDGKEHQTATIQLDFQLPKRFELEYIAPAPEVESKGQTTTDPELLAKSGPVRPVMIHRAVLGSVERFMALLIEHYNGKWPFWLNPKQISVMTVSDNEEIVAFAKRAVSAIQGERGSGTLTPRGLHEPVFAVDLDITPRSLNKKAREARQEGYGITVVVGRQNLESGMVSVGLRSLFSEDGLEKMQIGETVVTAENAEKVDMRPEQLRNLLLQLEGNYL